MTHILTWPAKHGSVVNPTSSHSSIRWPRWKLLNQTDLSRTTGLATWLSASSNFDLNLILTRIYKASFQGEPPQNILWWALNKMKWKCMKGNEVTSLCLNGCDTEILILLSEDKPVFYYGFWFGNGSLRRTTSNSTSPRLWTITMVEISQFL